MKKLYSLIVCLLGILFSVSGQFRNYELSQPDTGAVSYTGRDYVVFKPGYSFSAADGKELRANVKKTMSENEVTAFLKNVPSETTVLNTQCAVGEIPISSWVGSKGEKRYQVSIDCPAGRQGLQPSISLSYNSQVQNGVMGMGWCVNGLSAITRVAKVKFYDNTTSLVSLDNNDAFSLDGIRLLESARTAEKIDYDLAEGYAKVTAYLQADTIAYFKVFYPNGSVAVMGYEDNTQLRYSYPITKLTDINGNSISYTYTNDSRKWGDVRANEMYYIDKITYGGRGDLSHFSRIEFVYADRSDVVKSVVNDISRCIIRRLIAIKTYINDTEIKSYTLDYKNQSNSISNLVKIGCYAQGDSLNPIHFGYGDNQRYAFTTRNIALPNTNLDLSKVNVLRGKFDPNGYDDAIIVFPKQDYYTRDENDAVYRLSYPKNEYIKVFHNITSGVVKVDSIQSGEGFIGCYLIDTDRDGKDELIKFNTQLKRDDDPLAPGSYINTEVIIVNIYSATSDRGIRLTFSYPIFIPAGTMQNGDESLVSVTPKEIYMGNFTGEDKIQFLFCPVHSDLVPSQHVYFSNWNRSESTAIPHFTDITYMDKFLPMDVDSDGQMEMLVIQWQFTDIFKYKKNEGFVKVGQWDLKGNELSRRQLLFGDINCDGNMDYILSPEMPKLVVTERPGPAWFAGPLYVDDPYMMCPVCHKYAMRMVVRDMREGKNPNPGIHYIWYDIFTKKYIEENQASYCERVFCPKSCPIKPSPWDESVCNLCHHNASYPRIIANGAQSENICLGCGATFTMPIVEWSGKYCWVCHSPLRIDLLNYGFKLVCPDHDSAHSVDYVFKDSTIVKDDKFQFRYTNGKKNIFSNDISILIRENFHVFQLHEVNGDDVPDLIVKLNGNNRDIYSFDYKAWSFKEKNATLNNMPANCLFIDYSQQSEHKRTSLIAISPKALTIYSMARNHTFDNMITTMVNSTKVIEKVEYKQLYPGTHYNPGEEVTPFVSPMWVTSETTTLYNGEVTKNEIYTYNEGVVNREGLGFLGFNSIVATDRLRNRSLTTTYAPYLMGAVTEEQSDLKKTVYQYSYNKLPNNKVIMNVTQKTETDRLRGNTTTWVYSNFDDYGNVCRIAADYGNGISSLEEFTYNNIVSNDYRLLGQLVNKIETKVNGSDSHSRFIKCTYYGNQKLQSVTKGFGRMATNTETSAFEYNADGMLSRDILTDHLTGNVLSTVYDYWSDDKCSLKSVTDARGLTTTYGYDFTRRLPISTTDYLGKTSYVTYDKWRRIVREEYPDNTQREVVSQWTGNPQEVVCVTHTSTGEPTIYRYYDALGHEVRTVQPAFDGVNVTVRNEYDLFGRLRRSTLPYKPSESLQYSTYEYDEYDRVKTISQPGGGTTAYTYSGNTVTEEKDGMTVVKTTNAIGQLVQSTDDGGVVSYAYRADGQPLHVTANGAVTTFEYDNTYHRRVKMTDPSAGVITWQYDNAQNKVTRTWNNGKSITSQYNAFGDLVAKWDPGRQTIYTYSQGQLTGVNLNNGEYIRQLSYDEYGRLSGVSEAAYGKTYGENYTIENGLLRSVHYAPIDFTVHYVYNDNGYLQKITDQAGNTLREVQSTNAFGSETKVAFGNGTTTQWTYTPENFLQQIKTMRGTRTYQNVGYTYNRANGTILSRRDNAYGKEETFTYGALYRLQTYGTTTNPQSITYADNGNILSKSDAGSYTYNGENKPYTLTEVAYATDNLLQPLRAVYNVMSQPDTLQRGDYTAVFDYDDNFNRIGMRVSNQGETELTKTYFAAGGYEVYEQNGTESQRLYIDGSPNTASVLVEKTGDITSMYYICRDNLGSVTHISNNNGILEAVYSYDAWGRMIEPGSGSIYSEGSQLSLLFDRGYTGHEHLPWFGLIHMNARLYDPVLGRFISPDPLVAQGDRSNEYNRYVYARNNPLMYVDYDGKQGEVPQIGGRNPHYYGNPIPSQYNFVGSYSPGSSAYGYNNGGYNGDYSAPNFNVSGGRGSNVSVGGLGSLIYGFFNWLFSPKSSKGYNYMPPPPIIVKMEKPSLDQTSLKAPVATGITSVHSGGSQSPGVGSGQDLNNSNEWIYLIPVYGSCTASNEAFMRGNYIDGVCQLVFAGFDLFTMGVATELKIGMNFTQVGYKGVSKTITTNAAKNTGRLAQGWRVGQPIDQLTNAGKQPTWNTVRQRFWKNEAYYHPEKYKPENLIRMRSGKAAQYENLNTGIWESYELHHTPIPQKDGGLFEFIPLMREEHILIHSIKK